ncbi:MAG: trimethylamine methyltransferase family protein [Desulfobacterales bacterium]|nr:trimethylamine methyltransferase family protein [Desulfobacterales bacterium]
MVDAQGAHEKTMNMLLPALAGANMIYGLGMIDMGMACSFTQLVIDDEIAGMCKRVVNGVEFDDERMGVELIKEVGIGGNFLAQKHTMKYLAEEQSRSTIFDRRVRDSWVKRGAKNLEQVAKEKAKEILATHEPMPIDDKIKAEFKKIIKSAEK